MAINLINENKRNGIYYTPTTLAEFLAKPLINKSEISVFDPAYGEGALLLAAEKVFKEIRYSKNDSINLFGCDIAAPQNGSLYHLQNLHLYELDFFEYPIEHKFDVILMNPPYVRHHLIENEKIDFYRTLIKETFDLRRTSDLWTYFLIKSIMHLKKGGSVGAILPWSFLQADYARNLRLWLSERFGQIKILALSNRYFERAAERVVLIWLTNYGEPSKSIKIATAKNLDENVSYIYLGSNKWNADRITFDENSDIDSILSRFKNEFGFSEFENHAKVKIGVVTGADDYFIMSKKEANKLGFSDENLIPIFTSSKELSGFFNNGHDQLKRLIAISENSYNNFKYYIEEGERNQYHLRAHSMRRNPWYAVIVGEIPDAFFPYRMTKLPYLVLNDQKIQCTNSVHRIYFKNLTDIEKKWIQVSLFSAVGQLSIEHYSKTYGRGMLKIEPRALKKSLVFKNNDPEINSVYSLISKSLVIGNKVQAMKIATKFITKNLGIIKELSSSAEAALIEIQNRRLIR